MLDFQVLSARRNSRMPEYQAYRSRRTFGSLDGFRCFSILAVIWHHCSGGLEIGLISTRGFLGVDMFFVLSGFLIVTLLLREQDRNGQISLKAFYARRTLRIMPLYYGVVIASAGLFLGLRPEGNTAQTMRDALPFLLTYTTNWVLVENLLSITWSLSAEEQFYVVWPPIQKYVRQPLWILFALLLLSQLIHFGALDSQMAALGFGPDEPTMLRETTFTPILLGVLLAHLLHSPEGFRRVSSVLGHPMTSAILSLILLASLELMPADIKGWPRLTIHLLMMALLASAVVREDHVLAPLLKWRPVVRIGVLSYGMYLLHMFVGHFTDSLAERGLPKILLFPLATLGTVAVAELSYRYYETPFLKLKKRFAR